MAVNYLQAFGEPPPPIVGIALMTDTDNTGSSEMSYYEDPVGSKIVRSD